LHPLDEVLLFLHAKVLSAIIAVKFVLHRIIFENFVE